MNHWWSMHGYGCYIWSAYSLVIGVFILNGCYARWRYKVIARRLLQWFNGH